MAKALIRGISCLIFAPFQRNYTSIYNLPISHQILTCLNSQYLKKTQFKQVNAQLIISGRLKIPFFGCKLLRLSSQFGDLRSILWVFDRIDFPDLVCYNTLIKAFSNSCFPSKGVTFYFEMLKSEVFPNSFTFPPLIGCCAKVGDYRLGEMCHGQVIKNGFDGVMQIQNSLIHMYACCGVIEVALKVFEGMLERDLVTWNSILSGYVKVGDLRNAHKMFDVMPERNIVSWNAMMTGYLEGYKPGWVLKLFREMIRGRLIGNDITMVNVITACGRSARRREGASVHGFLIRRLWNLSLIMKSALIDMYNKCLKVAVARRIFDCLVERNLVCWNSMILGHCLHGNAKDGLILFENMIVWMEVDKARDHGYAHLGSKHGMLPDEITYIGVLCACTRAGLLEEGKTYFCDMMNLFNIKPNFAHFWCMANLLASKGLVQEALETIRNIKEFVVDKPLESLLWGNLLGSCRYQGDSSIAEQVAKALIEIEPQNTMCYAFLLNIYAAAGKWADAANVKELMKQRVPLKLHGCSLIDLIEVVHNFRLRDETWHEPEIVKMLDNLTEEFDYLDGQMGPLSMPKT
ncbi:pentatricopeptide repeat-containing protein At3g51320-like [Amaranthus tricolor]|uniref:pentatricopeptide repeat-containing protein At3g51320-like n=1 Tax=Amaranthus tricolor TaxID=29722 RepID=UPI0025893064|nr:pentatricopeptide repeat-containing protein At3g51320-like [Amaranthus tricolor]XP_057531035.1 pentatricopeptide repeat-containing protein At3g51320-like [Amaranthus tricolor]XP_057531036.1 pentatricopeptide repeat-containing protein At3g51320-like [Amaranthus tricolor]